MHIFTNCYSAADLMTKYAADSIILQTIFYKIKHFIA